MAKSSKRKLQNAFSQMQNASKGSKPAGGPTKKRVEKGSDDVSSTDKKSRPKKTKAKPQKNRPKTAQNTSAKPADKKGLHPRNLHRNGYDFKKLVIASPSLKPFVKPNPYGNLSIDFNDAEAVKALNLALLRHHYKIDYWDIPSGYLCPPIPGRADYIHHLADLLETMSRKETSAKEAKTVRVLDIGTGANGIYPILGIQIYGWQFVASDIDKASIANVDKIVKGNPSIAHNLQLRLQTKPDKIFDGIIQPGDQFDLTMCNPPFHKSLAEAHASSKEKLKNLAKNRSSRGHTSFDTKAQKLKLNFGGQKAELWCKGGERKFLFKMIRESKDYSSQCLWFTSLISKKENLKPCYEALKKAGAVTVKTINMVQGNKITRILAWSFK